MKNVTQKFIGLLAFVLTMSFTVNAQEIADNSLDLPEGWSMFGYTCIDSVDAILGFSAISDKIEIVKDEWGLSYIPSWEYNAMGSLQFSEGYQIKMTEEVTDFQFCEAIVPEDGITQSDLDSLIELSLILDDSLNILQTEIEILTDSIMNNNEFLPKIGDFVEGGIVFYVNESTTGGLVASISDIGSYPIGCEGFLLGTSQWIGAGYGNSIIFNNNCNEITTASLACSNHQSFSDGLSYSDWYLPSKSELYLIYSNLGPTSTFNNIANLSSSFMYANSTEYNSTQIGALYVSTGSFYGQSKSNQLMVRPIRAFGDWVLGCMNSSACNYNQNSNLSDGSCILNEPGFYCNGEPIEIGDTLYGGIIFYIDETGEHGLVASVEDIGTEKWSCVGFDWNDETNEEILLCDNIDGADDEQIGSGFDNTIDIVNYACSNDIIEYGGTNETAAQLALDYSSEGYTDWYLPSINELSLMTLNLGYINGGCTYWSSTEVDECHAYYQNFCFNTTSWGVDFKGYNNSIRPIRSF